MEQKGPTPNQCARCHHIIGNGEIGYYELNKQTDQFELLCAVHTKIPKVGVPT